MVERTHKDYFDEIAPYDDDGAKEVVRGYASFFSNFLVGCFFPNLSRILPSVESVLDFQEKIIFYYGQKILENSAGKVSYDFSDSIDPDMGYVFISNHRDIFLDNLLINLGINDEYGMVSSPLVGDNLYSLPFMDDFLRLNGSIKVYRGNDKREAVERIKGLYDYISLSVSDKNSVWVAQGKGRSKDGDDRTSMSVVKRLVKAGVMPENIIPVCISYEYNPCDRMMARELYHREKYGGYDKWFLEDMVSIVKGLFGRKGNIHVSFADPMEGYNAAKVIDLTESIDREIYSRYKIWDVNEKAFRACYGRYDDCSFFKRDNIDMIELGRFYDKFRGMSRNIRRYVLDSYANPLKNKMALEGVQFY